jgi:prepilin-type N-terminal cleavage/methylation domain-containing protein
MDGTDRHQGRSITFRPRPFARGVGFPASSRAFSLIELLVVIAILTVLVAVLVPVLARARSAAMKVVCAGRLRELTLASLMYREENKVLPEPLQQSTLDPLGQLVLGHAPQQVSTRLLNELRPYLKFPEVGVTTPACSLPPFVQCPFAEEAELDRGPTMALFESDVATYYTGYAYLARLEERPLPPPLPPATFITFSTPVVDPGVVLRPNRSAAAKDKRRAVLWADQVSRSQKFGGMWQYTHARRGGKPGPVPFTRLDWRGLIGQHRAYSDASVEWVGAGDKELKVDDQQFDVNASFKTGTEHWWF